jgi:C-terminal processing protease CtpA/Prc
MMHSRLSEKWCNFAQYLYKLKSDMKKIVFMLKRAQSCFGVLMSAILLICFIASCGKEPKNETAVNSYGDINDWILENMQDFYLWEEYIPSKTDRTLFPVDYFESLLYDAEDRFSWIQEDFVELLNSLSGVNTEAGYDYALMYLSQDKTDIIACITYIKPDTPAETSGLKRGDYFLTINGTQMTADNYRSLIGETSKPHTLGLAVFSTDGKLTGAIENVSLQVIADYAENPILLDTIYNISGRKIGYFVYNFFARDKGDGSVQYERELNSLFATFKAEGIDELIVDLRYNGGGAVSTTQTLASMISGQSENNVFYIYEYNKNLNYAYGRQYGANYNKGYFVDDILRGNGTKIESINKLSDLSSVYFIVTGNSASASELLINGLKPYMNNIVLVGGITYGKNVASTTIYESDKEKQKTNKWGMQPIIIKMANVDGFSDYGNGFVPDINVSEFDGDDPLKPLGDTDEVMLKTTINAILGVDTRVVTKKYTGNEPIVIGSSMDRTPARRNMYITPLLF